MDTIRRGTKAPQVKLAQRLVNLRVAPRPKIKEDGIFGPKTDAAIRQFQASKGVISNGIVDANTWRSLGVTNDISQRVKLYGQPTDMTCWSAAATMLLGIAMSVGPGSAATGPKGGLKPSFSNVKNFADSYGLHMHAPQCWAVPGIANLLRRGPVWVAGWVPFGHAVVYGAIHGDGTPEGTLIVIYDPWPPGRGEIRGELYGDWVNKHPTATTYILERP